MGVLNLLFFIRVYHMQPLVLLSMVTSSISLGMKLNKLTMLKHWCGSLDGAAASW